MVVALIGQIETTGYETKPYPYYPILPFQSFSYVLFDALFKWWIVWRGRCSSICSKNDLFSISTFYCFVYNYSKREKLTRLDLTSKMIRPTIYLASRRKVTARKYWVPITWICQMVVIRRSITRLMVLVMSLTSNTKTSPSTTALYPPLNTSVKSSTIVIRFPIQLCLPTWVPFTTPLHLPTLLFAPTSSTRLNNHDTPFYPKLDWNPAVKFAWCIDFSATSIW